MSSNPLDDVSKYAFVPAGNREWNTCLDPGTLSMHWMQAATTSAFSSSHIDAAGSATWNRILCGENIWWMARELTPSTSYGWSDTVESWYVAYLKPGDDLYMRPARNFGPNTKTSQEQECWHRIEEYRRDQAFAAESCVDKPSRWAISHMRGLPSYVDGRVALLGDSAHAMATHLGAGAGQAIEDGFVLGQLLSQRLVTRANVSLALKVYDAVRRPFGNGMVERSRQTGFLYEFNELPEFIDKHKLRDSSKVELEKLAKEIYKKWEVQWSALPDVEWKLAEKMLRNALDVSSGHDKPIMANL
ncbi:hypothetical protein EW145_g6350 [Phellinidium pouzarii]|uniref:FAD-binding domain-containing protein n=1 Tax=Phellinidium pouzarii TaxID=167371 RepID=A0A4S4KWX1_9AGAM|nr:hypothetical protein EW145_g6350 [Phellinidium pouzarii]